MSEISLRDCRADGDSIGNLSYSALLIEETFAASRPTETGDPVITVKFALELVVVSQFLVYGRRQHRRVERGRRSGHVLCAMSRKA